MLKSLVCAAIGMLVCLAIAHFCLDILGMSLPVYFCLFALFMALCVYIGSQAESHKDAAVAENIAAADAKAAAAQQALGDGLLSIARRELDQHSIPAVPRSHPSRESTTHLNRQLKESPHDLMD